MTRNVSRKIQVIHEPRMQDEFNEINFSGKILMKKIKRFVFT